VWYRVTYNGQIKYVSKDLITETNPNEKSNNVNLKSLTIENVNLEPTFSADTTEYSATIANYDSDKIDITAEAEDSKATVNIEGNTNLVLGENVIVITVTAEDGTTKIYTLTLTLSEEEIESLVLKSLTIKGVELKGFSPEKFEYDVEFKDLDKLEIEAIANEDDATVEILGNENLVEGENTITIIVTSKDGEQIVTYQIKANKLSNESQTQNKELNIKSMVIFGVIAIVILILIIALIIKFVKNNNTPTIDYEYNDNLSNDVDEEKIEQEDIKKDKLYNYDENEKIVKKNRKGKHSM
jgi:hypothetical protein